MFTRRLITLLSFGLYLIMSAFNAQAHWYRHHHPTVWDQVPHGVEHKHYDHRPAKKGGTIHVGARKYQASNKRKYWRKMKNYKFPMVGKQSLDYCYKSGHFCGRVAANEFCKLNGFEYASQFLIDRHQAIHTVSLGDRKVHTYPKEEGNGFTYIRCRKHA